MAKLKLDLENGLLDYIKKHPNSSSREIYEGLGNLVAFATVKRTIAVLIDKNFVATTGRGKSTKYFISKGLDVLFPIDIEAYFEKEIDDREVKEGFSFELIKEVLNEISIFTNDEMEKLSHLQDNFTENISKLTKVEYNKEFERLAIDLSWKSSQIEGNTYSLLETEKLLKEKETASGKTKDEAVMLLNHKAALDFILENPDYVNPLSVARIEDIHSLLVEGLGIDRNIRNRRVGISGTNYKPLDNAFQIKEALEDMCILINSRDNIFEKGLLALVLLSYIQAFSDGNKRTARIISNAILINYKYCPISFRTVDSIDYKKAMLVFYEQNNISVFKNIFIEQFEFAVKTYF
ncbi:MAG: Fic family protein [Flavobacterium sp.]|uniref:Fic family protein n=1 Tax=Flavobacterium sp. TaxID=239 RepID=UPI002625042F|nr:Fic family protein [Flavobacterium sp.]MDD5150963.1 Fic family protein [Flavobacterium sp.]